MKKFFLSLVAFSTLALVFCSCDNEEEDNNPIKTEQQNNDSTSFVGQLSVTFQGNDFITDDTKVSALLKGNAISLYFFGVKFVPQMPITIDLVVADIACSTTYGIVEFQGDKIIPTMAGAPYKQYVAEDIKGTIKDGTINFSLTFGGIPTKYSGVVVK